MFYDLGCQDAWLKLGFALPPRAQGAQLPQRAVQGRQALQTAAQSRAAKRAIRTPEELQALAAQRPKKPLELINPAAR